MKRSHWLISTSMLLALLGSACFGGGGGVPTPMPTPTLVAAVRSTATPDATAQPTHTPTAIVQPTSTAAATAQAPHTLASTTPPTATPAATTEPTHAPSSMAQPTSTPAITVHPTQAPASAAQATYTPVPTAYANQKPPFSLTSPDVIVKGKKIFEANCAPCHGMDGRGDGPAAAGLNPKPINFHSAYVKHMTPDYMFWRVNTGFTGSAMPAWKGLLTSEQIWEVIAYERTFKQE
jgi:mono/diheme cytochrome c family protein